MSHSVLSVLRVSKRFPPNIVALEHASIDIQKGEIHCLLGANGAGKSTFLKIIAGALRPSTGTVAIDGKTVFRQDHRFQLPPFGVSMIYQELDLVPQLSVEENMFRHAPAAGFWRKKGSSAQGH